MKNNFLYYILAPFVLSLPSRRLRLFFLRRFLHVQVGKGTIICRNVEIRNGRNITVGKNCVINSRTLLDGRGGSLIIGNNVDIAQETIIWTLSHDPQSHKCIGKDVRIGDYVWIGCRTTIMPGVSVGEDSICATCSVVTKNIAPNSIVGGVPAKIIAKRNRSCDYHLSFNSIFR